MSCAAIPARSRPEIHVARQNGSPHGRSTGRPWPGDWLEAPILGPALELRVELRPAVPLRSLKGGDKWPALRTATEHARRGQPESHIQKRSLHWRGETPGGWLPFALLRSAIARTRVTRGHSPLTWLQYGAALKLPALLRIAGRGDVLLSLAPSIPLRRFSFGRIPFLPHVPFAVLRYK